MNTLQSPAKPQGRPASGATQTRQVDASPTQKIQAPYIRPLAVIIGAVVGFSSCCMAGYNTTLKNQYGKSFARFGQLLSPEASFFPTAKQLVAIAHDKARKDQILVIVGGDSVFNGCGQPEDKLWSKGLQERLGDRYAVVNFAMRGGSPDTAGIIAATALSKEYKKTIFVASSWPEYYSNPKFSNYEYFYWDALYKGLLDRNPPRERMENERVQNSTAKEQRLRQELALHKRLDSFFYFDDLWTTLSYQKFFTVWNPLTQNGFTKPRRKFADLDVDPPPLATRFPLRKEELRYLGNASVRFVQQDRDGNWVPKQGVWSKLEQFATSVDPQLKKKSLIALVRECPAYLQKLTPSQQRADSLTYNLCSNKWRQSGFNAIVIGNDYTSNDYSDPRHLDAIGGAKLAQTMTTQITSLANQLGYIDDAKQ
jgi:hypothetical protein